MVALLQTHYPLSLHSPRYPYLFFNPNPDPYHYFFILPATSTKSLLRFNAAIGFSALRSQPHRWPAPPTVSAADQQVCSETAPLKAFVRVTVSAVLFLCLGVRVFSASSPAVALAAAQSSVQEEQTVQDGQDGRKHDSEDSVVDKELEAAFNAWKSKTYALTVPLKVIALRGSIPPSWIKDFINSQGRRMTFNVKYYASLESIFSDLSMSLTKGNIGPASALAADIVGIGDSWLKFAVNKAIIEPIRDVEVQEWFKSLDKKWKEL